MTNPEQMIADSRRGHESIMLANDGYTTLLTLGVVLTAAFGFGEIVNLAPINKAYFADQYDTLSWAGTLATSLVSVVQAAAIGYLLHLCIKVLGKTFERRIVIMAGLSAIPLLLSVPFVSHDIAAGAGAMAAAGASETGGSLALYARGPLVLLMGIATAFGLLMVELGYARKSAFYASKNATMKLDGAYEQLDDGLHDEKSRERRRDTLRRHLKESFAQALAQHEATRVKHSAALAKGIILGGQDFIDGIRTDLGRGLDGLHPDLRQLVRSITPQSIDLALVADGTPKLSPAEKRQLIDHLVAHQALYSQARIFKAIQNHS